MLKETETEVTIVFFVTFLSLVAFHMGGSGPLGPPLATPMVLVVIADCHGLLKSGIEILYKGQ